MKYRVGDRFMAKVKGEFLIREVIAVDCDHPHGYHYKMMANDSKDRFGKQKSSWINIFTLEITFG